MNIIQDTSNIKGIILPSSLIPIGNEAFWDCGSLTNISVPDSIINIGVGAFSASGLTSVRIPNSVTSMGDRIFDECIRITSITFDTGSNIDSTDFGLNAFSEGPLGLGGNTLRKAYLGPGGGAGTYTQSPGGSDWVLQ